MSFSVEALEASLREAEAAGVVAPFCVALSGGLDSTVVLHALVDLRGPEAVRAVHVDHGLHPDSPTWSEHCRVLCRSLGVPFDERVVRIERRSGHSPEAVARDVRYRVLRAALADGETLVTGHHADDQLETVILQLLRGAGTAGLAAMPLVTAFAPGSLFRPLLNWTRADLRDWATAGGLDWLEDPSNRELGFDRNYLRHEVLPALLRRWPGAARSAVRSARLCAEAARLTDTLAASDLDRVATGGGILVEPLLEMPEERTRNLLRYWLGTVVGQAPDSRRLAAIVRDVLPARSDAEPEVHWPAGAVRRYRDTLFALDARTREILQRPREALSWRIGEPLDLGPGLGVVRVRRTGGRGLAARWLDHGVLEVRFRAGGESIRPLGQAHRRPLKKLFQEAGVPPWWRDRVPLIYAGERLLAVGDLWIEESACEDDGDSWSPEWTDRPAAIVVPPVIW
jgi:tRNA(Ile)-lysidine synthase